MKLNIKDFQYKAKSLFEGLKKGSKDTIMTVVVVSIVVLLITWIAFIRPLEDKAKQGWKRFFNSKKRRRHVKRY